MNKNLIFLGLIVGMFTMGCNSFMVEGLLTQISHTIGQSIAVTGQGITLFSLTYFISAPLFSQIFAHKSVKFGIQLALLVFLIGNLITLLSKTISLYLIGMSLTGIGVGIFTPLCITMVVHFSDISVRGRMLSLAWGANSAGVVFGVPFGIYLSSYLNWQWSIAYNIILGLMVFISLSFQKLDYKLPVLPLLSEQIRLLCNQKILLVIGITCLISTACLGLYSYIAPIQSGSPYTLVVTLFTWGLGCFIGSSLVGIFVDLIKRPQMIMVLILVSLVINFCILPFIKSLPYLGLIPFFMWGALGWAITTPQQYILSEIDENQGTILAALNTSAIGLGCAIGTVMGGLIIASGFAVKDLPFLAAVLLFGVLLCQLLLMNISHKECNA